MILSRFTIYNNLHRIFIAVFLLFFFAQLIFWFKTENIKPNIHIVPSPPSKNSIAISSFGDDQFYFRTQALRIENAGDSFGRFSALKNYDYSKLYQWFKILDDLDSKSTYIPTLTAIYYSQTQKKEDNKFIVKYLDEYASRDIDKNWWWMFQAVNIANSSLKDHQLALDLAYKLSKNNNPKAPEWSRQMPAFIHSKMGDDCSAFLFIEEMMRDHQNGKRIIAPKEMEFMRYFIKQKLNNLKKRNFNPKLCEKISRK